jgi:hypothetical protein
MKARSNIKEIFEECRDKGLLIELESSYCSGKLISKGTKTGWICAASQDDDRIMEDIEGEGSAEVTWFFGPLEKIHSIGSILVELFTKHGYIVKWNKSMGGKITAVIEEEDLPLNFLEGWNNESDDEKDDKLDFDDDSYASDDENRINPEVEVVFKKEEEEQHANFQSDEDDEDDDEEDEKDDNTGPVIDLCSDNEEKDEEDEEEEDEEDEEEDEEDEEEDEEDEEDQEDD